MSHLQSLEEDLVDGHRSVILNLQRWALDDASLLAVTNEVDYDQDGQFMTFLIRWTISLNKNFISAYCQQLEAMISEKIQAFVNLRDKARL